MATGYKNVNGQWPAPEGELPKLTSAEAITAARKLYRFAFKRTFRGKVRITSGRRYNWIRRGVLIVNPDRGWWHLVHDLSHYASFRLYPKAKAHSMQHAFLERSMIEHAVKSGWLEGKLRRPDRPKAPAPDPRTVRITRLLARIEAWKRKRRRAETALRKLERSRMHYHKLGYC